MECQYRSPGGETERVRRGDHECVCSVPTGGDVLDADPRYPVVPLPWDGSMWAYEPNDLKYIMKEPTLQGMLAQAFSFHQLLTPLTIGETTSHGKNLTRVSHLPPYPSCSHCRCHCLWVGNRYKSRGLGCCCYLMGYTAGNKKQVDNEQRNHHVSRTTDGWKYYPA